MSEDIELKADDCPFCGFTAPQITIRSAVGASHWLMFCGRCDARGPISPTEAEAIAAWNRRALSPPLELGGEREAIATIIDPEAFGLIIPWTRLNREAALAKADAILSRRSTLPVGSQGVMASVAESTDAPAYGVATVKPCQSEEGA